MMKKIKFFLFISPAVLLAGEMNFGIINNAGKSTYVVKDLNRSLKAKLEFPFRFYSGNIGYKQTFSDFTLDIDGSFLLHDNKKIGKDYDWKDEDLTVYSESENSIDKYYEIGVELSKNMYRNLDFFISLKYSNLDFNWKNTNQQDYVQNDITKVDGLTLSYEQEMSQLNIGLVYKSQFHKFNFDFIPSFVYSNVKTKDTHILRNFYAIQNCNSLGFSLRSNIEYEISKNSSIDFSAQYEELKDNNVPMKYYNDTLGNYQNLPSSFRFKNTKLGLNYRYKF